MTAGAGDISGDAECAGLSDGSVTAGATEAGEASDGVGCGVADGEGAATEPSNGERTSRTATLEEVSPVPPRTPSVFALAAVAIAAAPTTPSTDSVVIAAFFMSSTLGRRW